MVVVGLTGAEALMLQAILENKIDNDEDRAVVATDATEQRILGHTLAFWRELQAKVGKAIADGERIVRVPF